MSKFQNAKVLSIKSLHIASVFISKLNCRSPNAQNPFDLSSAFFSDRIKTKTNAHKADFLRHLVLNVLGYVLF